jgi:dihydrolipoamide dehydrogenase
MRPRSSSAHATRRRARSWAYACPTRRSTLPRPCAGRTASSQRLTGGVGALLRKAGVQVHKGWAEIEDGKTVIVKPPEGEPLRVRCEHLLLATGSTPVELPSMPFGGAIWSSTDALSPDAIPKRLVVVGAGYIGLELGMAYRKLGVEVTVVEALQRVLPTYDEELTQPVLDALQKSGIVLHLGCSVQGHDDEHGVHVRNDARAEDFALPADRVLVAVGRRPHTTGFGLESLQLDMAGRHVAIDAHCRTSMRNVWAIGDVTGEPMLAHRAMAQGECVAEQIAGKNRRFEPMAIPAVCFTDPEVVVVGKTPGRGARRGHRLHGRRLPLCRQRPCHDAGGHRRLRARGGTQETTT